MSKGCPLSYLSSVLSCQCHVLCIDALTIGLLPASRRALHVFIEGVAYGSKTLGRCGGVGFVGGVRHTSARAKTRRKKRYYFTASGCASFRGNHRYCRASFEGAFSVSHLGGAAGLARG